MLVQEMAPGFQLQLIHGDDEMQVDAGSSEERVNLLVGPLGVIHFHER